MLKKMFLGAILVAMTPAAWAAGSDGTLYAKIGAHVTSMTLSYVDWWNVTQTNTYSNSGQEPGLVTDQVVWAGYGVAVHGITVANGYQANGFKVLDYHWVEGLGYVTTTNDYSGTTGHYTNPQMADSKLTVIANDATPIVYSISYNWNNGTPPSTYATSFTVESPTITLPEPTRTGYDFGGWYANSGFSGDAVAMIPTGSVSNRTFYAKWTPQVYSVTFNFNGGWISWGGSEEQITSSPFVTNYTYGVGLSLPSFGRTGYLSGGWHLVQDCSDPAVTSIGSTESGDKVFWAKLTEQTYTVTLDNQGADVSGTSSVSVRYNGDFPASIICPKKAGYDFDGYFAQAGGQGTQYYEANGAAYGNAWATADDGTIYAHWIPHAYTLSFAPGEGGSGAMAPMAMTYGVETNLPPVEFAREGYVFAGWKTNLTAGVTFADGQAVSNLTTVADGAVTMTATWAKGSYYVAFDANGGEGTMDVQKFTYDVSAPLTTNAFTFVGHDFAGWAWSSTATTNDIAFTNCETVSNLTVVVDSTNTLYAVWKAEEYEVVLDANEGRGGYFLDGEVTNYVKVATVTYGEQYNLPTPMNLFPWKPFAGWKYIDGDDGLAKPLPNTVSLYSVGITNIVAQWIDGLKDALNSEGTGLDYTTGGYNNSQGTQMDVSWLPVEKDGADVGQSGVLPEGVESCYTYVRTTLPGKGVLMFNWRLTAPVGYGDTTAGNYLGLFSGNDALVQFLMPTGIVENAWQDSGWRTVSFTNTADSLDVEWRFYFTSDGYISGGGTGWVDNVTWTPAGGLKPGKVPLGPDGSPMAVTNGMTTVHVTNTVQGWWYGLYSKTNLADMAEKWMVLDARKAGNDDEPIEFSWSWDMFADPQRFFKIILSEEEPHP